MGSSNPEYSEFGKTSDGRTVGRFSLVNQNGLRVELVEYGASIIEVWTPDRHGALADIVLGFDNLAAYEEHNAFFGCTVGRVANRIANAEFELDGKVWRLTPNEGRNQLHGGVQGFDKAVWKGSPLIADNGVAVVFQYTSPDGEEGYPGTVSVEVIYTLTDDDALHIEYRAETSRPTLLNLTNHSYWNLGGEDVRAYDLELAADRVLESDEALIPTGRTLPVSDTAYDFREPTPLGQRLDAVGGFDTTYVLSEKQRPAAVSTATLHDPVSGRVMSLATTEPAIQFYTGNHLDGVSGKKGRVYNRYGGLCLETQVHPDACHHDNFPDIVLRPDQLYYQQTIHRFSVR